MIRGKISISQSCLPWNKSKFKLIKESVSIQWIRAEHSSLSLFRCSRKRINLKRKEKLTSAEINFELFYEGKNLQSFAIN